jgi:hypothetical protein
MSEWTEVLRRAVEDGQVVAFRYNGLARVALPVILGLIGSHFAILAYQFAGESQSGDMPHWKLFYLGRIEGMVVEEIPAPPLPEYTVAEARFTEICAVPRLRTME